VPGYGVICGFETGLFLSHASHPTLDDFGTHAIRIKEESIYAHEALPCYYHTALIHAVHVVAARILGREKMRAGFGRQLLVSAPQPISWVTQRIRMRDSEYFPYLEMILLTIFVILHS
jgi:hypothetical protein